MKRTVIEYLKELPTGDKGNLYSLKALLEVEVEDSPRIYASADVLDIVNMLLENNETPAAGTAGESR